MDERITKQVRGSTFAGCEVELDGTSFTDCTFDNVTFVFGGGYHEFGRCTFAGTINWRFVGPLGDGLNALHDFAHMAGPKSVKAFVDSFTAFFRSTGPKRDVFID